MTDSDDTRRSFTAKVKEQTPVKMRRAQVVPEEIVAKIAEACGRCPQVRSCYLLDVIASDEPDNEMLFVLIEVKSEADLRASGAIITDAISKEADFPRQVFVADQSAINYDFSMLEPVYRRRSWIEKLFG